MYLWLVLIVLFRISFLVVYVAIAGCFFCLRLFWYCWVVYLGVVIVVVGVVLFDYLVLLFWFSFVY